MNLQDMFNPRPRDTGKDVMVEARRMLDESGRDMRRPLRILLDAAAADDREVFAENAPLDVPFPDNFIEGEHVWPKEEAEALSLFQDDAEISRWLCGPGRKCLLVARLFEDKKEDAVKFIYTVYNEMGQDMARETAPSASL